MTAHQTAAELAAQHGIYKSTGHAYGQPKFALRCPLVESKSGNSVHIWDGGDGYIAVDDKHASCDNKAVRDALGIRHKGSGGPPPPIRARPKQEPEPPPKPGPLPSGRGYYRPSFYTDAEDTPVLAVVRKDLGINVETGNRRKIYPQYVPAPDAPGLWLLGGMKGLQPLYHLRAVLDAPPDNRVTIVEGEKCVGGEREGVARSDRHDVRGRLERMA